MRLVLHGETITVLRPTKGEPDPFGQETRTWTEEHVDNVLVAEGTGTNSTDATRPDGITVSKSLSFPRTWAYRSLRGCKIRIDTVEYTVLGDPRPYDGGIKPSRWNLLVHVTDTRG